MDDLDRYECVFQILPQGLRRHREQRRRPASDATFETFASDQDNNASSFFFHFACRGKLYQYTVCHFGARFSAALSTVNGCTSMIFFSVWKRQRRRSWQHAFAVFCTLGCPISWHKIVLGRQGRWNGLDINFSSCFWQIPKDKKKGEPYKSSGEI